MFILLVLQWKKTSSFTKHAEISCMWLHLTNSLFSFLGASGSLGESVCPVTIQYTWASPYFWKLTSWKCVLIATLQLVLREEERRCRISVEPLIDEWEVKWKVEPPQIWKMFCCKIPITKSCGGGDFHCVVIVLNIPASNEGSGAPHLCERGHRERQDLTIRCLKSLEI